MHITDHVCFAAMCVKLEGCALQMKCKLGLEE